MSQQEEGMRVPPIGSKTSFSKTVSESDIYLFAGISGDFDPVHVNLAFVQEHGFRERIAHGVLILGYTSACATQMERHTGRAALSYGYDRVRFIKPVYIGDTITVDYEITEHDLDRERTFAQIRVTNQDGELVAVATHIAMYV